MRKQNWKKLYPSRMIHNQLFLKLLLETFFVDSFMLYSLHFVTEDKHWVLVFLKMVFEVNLLQKWVVSEI